PRPIRASARCGASPRNFPARKSAASGGVEPAGIAARIGDIDRRRPRKSRDLLRRKIAHDTRRRAQDHLAILETLAFGDQRAGPDQRARADAGAVEQDGAHADQRAVADLSRMHDDAMADGNGFADQHGLARIGMKNAMILDVGLLADRDPFIVAPQHGAEPDAGAGEETHLADQHRVRRDKAAIGDLGAGAIERINRHASLLYFCSLENFTHTRAKKDTLKSDEVIRLIVGVRALVHLALRSPRKSGPARRTTLPSHSPISIIHRESSWPNAPCVRSRVTLPMPKRMCIRFFPAAQITSTKDGHRTIPMANSG